MILPGEIEIVQEFARANRDNLCATLKVCSSYQQIRGSLIKDFLKILKSFLLDQLGTSDWAVDDRLSDHLNESYPRFIIFKPRFGKGYYYVALEPQAKVARKIFYGVTNGEGKVLQPANNEIYDYLQQKNLGNSYNPNQYWSWGKYLDQNYQNWGDMDVLIQFYESIQLYKQQGVVPGVEFGLAVDKIGKPLVEIVKALDTIMERNETNLEIKETEIS